MEGLQSEVVVALAGCLRLLRLLFLRGHIPLQWAAVALVAPRSSMGVTAPTVHFRVLRRLVAVAVAATKTPAAAARAYSRDLAGQAAVAAATLFPRLLVPPGHLVKAIQARQRLMVLRVVVVVEKALSEVPATPSLVGAAALASKTA